MQWNSIAPLAALFFMPVPEPYCFFVDPLEATGLEYCVTGSLAAGAYGEYRLTADIDLIVVFRMEDIERLRVAFPEKDYYVPPIDVLISEARRPQRGMFNLIHQGTQFKADIFVAATDPLHLWALKNRRRGDLLGGDAWVAPPEYVIIRKLEYFREGDAHKHPRDIKFMVATTELDHAFLDSQIDRLGLREQWARCQPDVK